MYLLPAFTSIFIIYVTLFTSISNLSLLMFLFTHLLLYLLLQPHFFLFTFSHFYLLPPLPPTSSAILCLHTLPLQSSPQ